ncbi:uncharacterized protein LOC132277478 [Cornus florida]|uniref:uncharacterized protein LOC132277478 n=1 Tax=Cornus florida TaxID=4283 RepID=UPI0028993777|nr:uncharacterized protein LOC132277478 [Cornus florida]
MLEFDFVVFDMMGFDVILGMDWLSFFRATIDYFRGRVSICTPAGDCFHFMGDRSDSHPMMIFSIGDWSCHRSYLASLLVDEGSSLGRVFSTVVDEFLDVFPEELTELPPLREVVFAIDVIPGTMIGEESFCPQENEQDTKLDELMSMIEALRKENAEFRAGMER